MWYASLDRKLFISAVIRIFEKVAEKELLKCCVLGKIVPFFISSRVTLLPYLLYRRLGVFLKVFTAMESKTTTIVLYKRKINGVVVKAILQGTIKRDVVDFFPISKNCMARLQPGRCD